MQGISRIQLQRLAENKLLDAAMLYEAGRWGNAYYLAGYAVEFALKACAARQFAAESLPDRKFVQSLHTHELEKLVGLAGLRRELAARQDQSSAFAANWVIVLEWSPESRYDVVDRSTANYMIDAVRAADNGVFQWIKMFW